MKEKMMRIIVTVMLTLLLCSLTLLAGAASKMTGRIRQAAMCGPKAASIITAC